MPCATCLLQHALASLVSGSQVGVAELHLVAQLFTGAKSEKGLDEDEFVEAMASAFSAPQAKLRVLFRKVDASAVSLHSEGLV
jgi:hypothetical protein